MTPETYVAPDPTCAIAGVSKLMELLNRFLKRMAAPAEIHFYGDGVAKHFAYQDGHWLEGSFDPLHMELVLYISTTWDSSAIRDWLTDLILKGCLCLEANVRYTDDENKEYCGTDSIGQPLPWPWEFHLVYTGKKWQIGVSLNFEKRHGEILGDLFAQGDSYFLDPIATNQGWRLQLLAPVPPAVPRPANFLWYDLWDKVKEAGISTDDFFAYIRFYHPTFDPYSVNPLWPEFTWNGLKRTEEFLEAIRRRDPWPPLPARRL
jgi:hypothetical protein